MDIITAFGLSFPRPYSISITDPSQQTILRISITIDFWRLDIWDAYRYRLNGTMNDAQEYALLTPSVMKSFQEI